MKIKDPKAWILTKNKLFLIYENESFKVFTPFSKFLNLWRLFPSNIALQDKRLFVFLPHSTYVHFLSVLWECVTNRVKNGIWVISWTLHQHAFKLLKKLISWKQWVTYICSIYWICTKCLIDYRQNTSVIIYWL